MIVATMSRWPVPYPYPITRAPLSGISCTRGRTDRTSRRTFSVRARTSGASVARSASTSDGEDLGKNALSTVVLVEPQTQRQQHGDQQNQDTQEHPLRRQK